MDEIIKMDDLSAKTLSLKLSAKVPKVRNGRKIVTTRFESPLLKFDGILLKHFSKKPRVININNIKTCENVTVKISFMVSPPLK